ncbi:phosphoribosylformylglycinamidine synthase subunit PurS [Candidatus Palauibacter sp.]|uniref:phosphoribosylformylglycinamidine synthase subunit PurS n=1 Tax=Candidatus Palauibacter sp. TaxID=3101350 RepID=UPI003B5BE4C6
MSRSSRVWSVDVRITPRGGILDPAGETIRRALGNLGYEGVRSVRAGRLIRLEVEAEGAEAAQAATEKMCEQLIANPIIEDYVVRVHEEGTGG